jgi:hypothetical protein
VVGYVHHLVGTGVQVDLIVPAAESTRRAPLDRSVRVHPLMTSEARHPVFRLEQLLVFRVPGAILVRARSLARRCGLGPADRLLTGLTRGHRRTARMVHRRMFMPFYRHLRPWLLALRARRALRDVDLTAVDRIVAADVHAVALGWRLARRHPEIPATTALDRKPIGRRSSHRGGLAAGG